MTLFLDVRLHAVGGELSPVVNLFAGSSTDDYATIPRQAMLEAVQWKNVLIGTHGFNVNRADGIQCLDYWGSLLQLSPQDVFIGLLWPGDSSWAHGLDYGCEPKVADQAGVLLGPFLDDLLADAASVSFASHSLGARVILQTVQNMTTNPRRLIMMAGAIDDDCLTKEFKAVTDRTEEISVLASKGDKVLSLAFPLGNLLAGIIDQGHPWWRGALGRGGPTRQRPANFRGPYELPNEWKFEHDDYLRITPASTIPIAMPIEVPSQGLPLPTDGADGWQETWSSAFASTRFRKSAG
jgi:Alpha/beta hydrolase of unknown function (DUF900)